MSEVRSASVKRVSTNLTLWENSHLESFSDLGSEITSQTFKDENSSRTIQEGMVHFREDLMPTTLGYCLEF